MMSSCYLIIPTLVLKKDGDIMNTFFYLSVTLSSLKPPGRINQTCCMTSPYGQGVREQHFSLLSQVPYTSENFFQGQGIVRECFDMSGKNEILQKCHGILHFSLMKLGCIVHMYFSC